MKMAIMYKWKIDFISLLKILKEKEKEKTIKKGRDTFNAIVFNCRNKYNCRNNKGIFKYDIIK